MKKRKLVMLALMAAASLAMAACGSKAKNETPKEEVKKEETVKDNGPLVMATTTSTDNTGLLDYLQPIFKEDTGYDLQWTAVGTGAALQMGQDGEVDVVLVHSKAKEEEFVANGYGVERVQVMYNDFVIVGPKNGPVKETKDIQAAFKQIKDDSLVFVSRGDDSGTHNKETGIWKAIGMDDYESNPNYISAGAGMGDTINMTNEKAGYCLSDRGTWLANADKYPELAIVCEGDPNLLNQYGVIAVNPEKYPDVNNKGAEVFIKWICSPEVQKLIGEFGVKEYGEPLFTPNAE